MFFKNKHVVVAMLVAPVLAIGAYYAVDYVVAERPQPAAQGAVYELLAKPNCRYASGLCSFKNGNFEVSFSVHRDDSGANKLMLVSTHALEGVRVDVAMQTSKSSEPYAMRALDSSAKNWELVLNAPLTADAMMRIAVAAAGAKYFGETVTAFVDYKTGFAEDFRH